MLIGYSILTFGLILALGSAAKFPSENALFADTMAIYLIAMGLLISGAVILCKETKKRNQQHRKRLTEHNNLHYLLTLLLSEFKQLSNRSTPLDQPQLLLAVQCIKSRYMIPITEQLQPFSELMRQPDKRQIMFALTYGERLLNRIDSALNDGHLGEVRQQCTTVISAFEEALALVEHDNKNYLLKKSPTS